MKKNRIITLIAVIALVLTTTGCGKEVKVKGEAVNLKGISIKANDYYKEIKKDNISKLVDMIDHEILDKKYKTDKEEKDEINSQIDQIRSYFKQYSGKRENEELTDEEFEEKIQQNYGVENEKELRNLLSLEYKRKQAVNDYIKKNLSSKEIKEYYEENIYGDMTASHILISTEIKEDATDDEKDKAEKEAKKKAEKVIKELDKGAKFADLAKKYSDDEATANNGGDLGKFKYDEMVEEFSKACKDLKENKYTKEPVKTEYGYHIILKTKQEKKPKLSKVKKDIKETLTENKLDEDATLYYKTLRDIRKDKKIKWTDKKLKKAYKKYINNLIEQAAESQKKSEE